MTELADKIERGIATFKCPKHKCRHQWEQVFENAVRNSDCPACDAKDIAPVWIETNKVASCTCGDSAMVGNECKSCGARAEA